LIGASKGTVLLAATSFVDVTSAREGAIVDVDRTVLNTVLGVGVKVTSTVDVGVFDVLPELELLSLKLHSLAIDVMVTVLAGHDSEVVLNWPPMIMFGATLM
jgi:hypothetical protein